MQGKKKDELSAKWILERISEWQVYNLYIPNLSLNRKMKSPFRKEDTPSFRVKASANGLWHMDYGATQFRGGCFDFVQQLFGLDYPKALKKVAQDAGLIDGVENVKRLEWEQPEIIEAFFYINVRVWAKWKKWHKDYLQGYFLTPDDLNFAEDTKAYPLKEWSLNGSRMPLDEQEVGIVYNLTEGDESWRKVYRPNRPKEDKWRSNIPFDRMMGLANMEGCQTGIITKSVKDAAIIKKYITPSVSVVQAEDYAAITPENVRRINEMCNKVYISFDSDSKGRKAAEEICKETGWGNLPPPIELYEKDNITDWADFAKGYGIEQVIDYFKNKKVIS